MSVTKQRTIQYIVLLLIFAGMAGGYWYWKARGATSINTPNKNGLIGYWTFDSQDISGTSVTDKSGSGNTGTLTNGPTIVSGKFAQAAQFVAASSQYFKVTHTAALNAYPLTVAIWFKSADGILVNKYANSSFNGYYLYFNGTNLCAWYMKDGSNYVWDGGSCPLSTPGYFNDPNWHQAVFTVDSSGGKLYVDGALKNSLSWTGTPGATTTTQDLHLAKLAAAASYSNGTMDDFRVYNRALSATEITNLYNQQAAQFDVPQPTRDSLSDGLAGYWKLDDGSGTTATDSSTSGNNGTLTNGPTWGTGQIGNSVVFDGTNDYITVPDAFSLNPTKQITTSLWAKRARSATREFLMSKGAANSPETNNFYLEFQADNTVRFTGSDSGDHAVASSATISDTAWHHIAVTWDGKTVTIYVDGVQQSTTASWSGTMNSNTDDLAFGTRSSGHDLPFQGSLDEIRLYSRALSAEEVSKLYQLRAPSDPDRRLKGYWSFDQRAFSGTTTALDLSGAGNTGTLTNSPTKTIGIAGQALSFDGSSSYVTTADQNYFSPSVNPITISIWAKIPTTAAAQGNGACGSTGRNLMAKGNTSQWEWVLENDNNTLLCFSAYSLDGVTTYGSLTNSMTLNDGAWHYYVGVITYGVSMSLYIDGSLVASTTSFSGSMGNGTQPVEIGRRGDGNYFLGALDEPRIYNVALSASEIYSLYQQGREKLNVSQGSSGRTTLNDGLTGYFKMDEGSGTTTADSSGNGLTTTFTGSPSWTTGKMGGALTFDGSTNSVATSSFTQSNTAFSWSLWINPANLTQSGDILSKNSILLRYLAAGYQGTHVIRFYWTGANFHDTVSLPITAGTWSHIVGVQKNNLYTIYYNGRNFGSSTDATNLTATTSGAMTIGAGFAGSVDEVRLYNRALSDEEVTTLYNTTNPTNPDTGLVGYWSFNGPDVSGTTAYDRSRSGNNGTLTNGPTLAIGKVGQALNLAAASSQYVSVGSVSSLNFGTSNFTLSAWIKPPNANQCGPIISKLEVGAPAYGFYAGYIDGTGACIASKKISCYAYAGGGWASFAQAVHTSADVVDGSWHHVVCERLGNNSFKIYVDGADKTLTTDVAGSGGVVDVTNAGSFNVGFNGASTYYNGLVDEVRAYNRALSATEVTNLYNFGR